MRNKIIFIIICSILAMLSGCASKAAYVPMATSSPDEPIEIRVMLQHGGEDSLEPNPFLESAALYTKEHPNVTFSWEYDNNSYHKRIASYAAENNMPDIFLIWSGEGYLDPFIDSGRIRDLPAEEFSGHGFAPGALESYTIDGKLYGLPTFMNYMYIQYNEALFRQFDIPIPKTITEFENAILKFRENGITPIAMWGDYSWVQMVMIVDLSVRLNGGDKSFLNEATYQKIKFSDTPVFSEATDLMRRWMDEGIFPDNWLELDKVACLDMFKNGQAAMLYGGGSNLALGADETIPLEIRNSMRCMQFPSRDETDSSSTIAGSAGPALAIGGNTKHYDIVVDILKEWMRPEVYAKQYWQSGLGIPAQDFSQYITSDDPALNKSCLEMIEKMDTLIGPIFVWNLNTKFDEDCTKYFRQFMLREIEGEELWRLIDESAFRNQVK